MEIMRITFDREDNTLDGREYLNPYHFIDDYKTGVYDGCRNLRVEFIGVFTHTYLKFKNFLALSIYLKSCSYKNEKIETWGKKNNNGKKCR